ncbi:protoporphyrinogen oxidase [Aquibacillus kalidii]|uniref:protoporphyrinogen oxidase n=1 Tax=Aquibacillus kalidii TaxID=2762597 RepID=UPI001646FBD7|nr:protoporphyrinogen oxidase [Aquibacillus kalidii]
METVLVIGGGITGLSAAHELDKWKKQNASDIRLMLVEANKLLGGKIHTEKQKGFVMETGADSIVARKENVIPFIEELGLESEVVYNASGSSYLYIDGELKQIPTDAVFGIPAGLESLVNSTLVSAEGKVAALKDYYTPNDSFTKKDSVGSFLEHFLGKELVEKQIAPVLSGVYSGSLHDLTIGATLPYLLDYKKEYGSIMKGVEANMERFRSGGDKKFISFQGGMSILIDTLEKKLANDVDILKGVKATSILKKENGYQVTFDNGEIVKAQHIILSIPDEVAADLFEDNQLQAKFEPFKSSSLISIYLGYNVPDSVLPTNGTGFITASSDEVVCNACTWTSKKWEHTSDESNLLVRLFYKSNLPIFEKMKFMSEEELFNFARGDIKKALGLEVDPVISEVTNWSDNMPNYQKEHADVVQDLEAELETNYPGIYIAGCSYYGVGIPDCIKNGKVTAERLIKDMH